MKINKRYKGMKYEELKKSLKGTLKRYERMGYNVDWSIYEGLIDPQLSPQQKGAKVTNIKKMLSLTGVDRLNKLTKSYKFKVMIEPPKMKTTMFDIISGRYKIKDTTVDISIKHKQIIEKYTKEIKERNLSLPVPTLYNFNKYGAEKYILQLEKVIGMYDKTHIITLLNLVDDFYPEDLKNEIFKQLIEKGEDWLYDRLKNKYTRDLVPDIYSSDKEETKMHIKEIREFFDLGNIIPSRTKEISREDVLRKYGWW